MLVILSDELRPDDISRMLGLDPDTAGIRGEPMRGARPYPHHTWRLESWLPKDTNPEEHVDRLLDRLDASTASIASLAADPRIHSIRLWLSMHIDNANPGLSLPDPLIHRIARLGTGLEIDIYVDVAYDLVDA